MEEQDHMALASHRRSSTEGQGLQCRWSLFPELPTLGQCRRRAVSRPCCRLGTWVDFHSTSLGCVFISLSSWGTRWHV